MILLVYYYSQLNCNLLTLTFLNNTNGQNFELFATVGEAKGIGVPLTYLLVSTSKDAAPGAKQKVLESWLNSVKDLGINPEFVLTDKDQSEINAA